MTRLRYRPTPDMELTRWPIDPVPCLISENVPRLVSSNFVKPNNRFLFFSSLPERAKMTVVFLNLYIIPVAVQIPYSETLCLNNIVKLVPLQSAGRPIQVSRTASSLSNLARNHRYCSNSITKLTLRFCKIPPKLKSTYILSSRCFTDRDTPKAFKYGQAVRVTTI